MKTRPTAVSLQDSPAAPGRRRFLFTLLGALLAAPAARLGASPAPERAALTPDKIPHRGGTPAPPAATTPKRATITLNKVHVAGFQYHHGPALLAAHALPAGEPLTLRAEPDNPHDRFAVRLEARGQKIGYIPRTENHHLSRLLRAGASLTACVLEAHPADPPWRQVRVVVAVAV